TNPGQWYANIAGIAPVYPQLISQVPQVSQFAALLQKVETESQLAAQQRAGQQGQPPQQQGHPHQQSGYGYQTQGQPPAQSQSPAQYPHPQNPQSGQHPQDQYGGPPP